MTNKHSTFNKCFSKRSKIRLSYSKALANSRWKLTSSQPPTIGGKPFSKKIKPHTPKMILMRRPLWPKTSNSLKYYIAILSLFYRERRLKLSCLLWGGNMISRLRRLQWYNSSTNRCDRGWAISISRIRSYSRKTTFSINRSNL